MADIAVTPAQVAPIFPSKADIRAYIAAVPITRGQAVYVLPAGTVGLADANAVGAEQFRGIALGDAAPGGAVDVLSAGEIAGFAVGALNADQLLYLSNTAGAIADLPGALSVGVGRVTVMSDRAATKVVRIATRWDENWV